MDIEQDMVVDDLESLVADEDDGLLGDAEPTLAMSAIQRNCS